MRFESNLAFNLVCFNEPIYNHLPCDTIAPNKSKGKMEGPSEELFRLACGMSKY